MRFTFNELEASLMIKVLKDYLLNYLKIINLIYGSFKF